MEIQNISVYRKQEKEENGTFGQQNFLSIGKKGQILQGTLTVSRIVLRFRSMVLRLRLERMRSKNQKRDRCVIFRSQMCQKTVLP